MTEAELMLTVESMKKSGAIAAILNLVIPGAGYMYCGRWILGIIAFVFVVSMALMSFGVLVLPLWLVMIVDGLLCANRYNKKLIEQVLAEHRATVS